MNTQALQQRQLEYLLRKASRTAIGRKYKFGQINSYAEYKKHVPLHTYGDIQKWIDKIKEGGRDILWPGGTTNFAVSAGTTGEGKHLPLSPERISSDRRFLRKIAFSYLYQRPNILKLFGRHLSLPGSISKKQTDQRVLKIGEISGFLAERSPAILSWLQVCHPKKLVYQSFSRKFNLVLRRAVHHNIRVITAAPSWILTLFQETLRITGAEKVRQIWPNLRLIIAGGVKLGNYRSFLNHLYGDSTLDYIETYGASEGYFSFADQLHRNDMRLVIDNGLFYEWQPVQEKDGNSRNNSQNVIPTWKVEKGIPYELIVTNNSGLWRYRMDDVVTFTRVNPPRIRVAGRINQMLDDYGEAVYGWELERALEEVANKLDISIGAFAVGSYLRDEWSLPRHYWFIQGIEEESTLQKVEKNVDVTLRNINRHYDVRRESQALDSPVIFPITQQHITKWLAERGKDDAQGKFPRVLSDRKDIEKLLNISKQ